MSGTVVHEVRRGAYFDSIVLMQLQAGLVARADVDDAAAVMATPANLALLEASALKPAGTSALRPDDLVIAVRAADRAAGEAALGAVDGLLARRASSGHDDDELRPRSLRTAWKALPGATWVAVSVPGRYAAALARDALAAGRNVFLYSDNVSPDDEIDLKRRAADRGLLVMGPDCGTAVVGGVGLGFANRVRAGAIGLVGASGTGLQAIASEIHRRGAGISHALGTGGRDLGAGVGGATTLAALAALAADRATRVLVLVSKPPSPAVAARVLAAARAAGKPVVICFLGLVPPAERVGAIRFARGLDDAARLACEALDAGVQADPTPPPTASRGDLRALFAGGTLAYETLLQLRLFVSPLASNTPIDGVEPVADPARSSGHVVLDLGSDEYTVGRAHPMIDPDLRLRRFRQEAADPDVGTILVDVVLGVGGHADPAAGLAPAIADAKLARPSLRVLAMVVGTDEDPQDREAQVAALRAAGAEVHETVSGALAAACLAVPVPATAPPRPPVASALATPRVVNVGLALFHASVAGQGASAVQVEWRPPAGGDERLAALLERMKT